MNRIIALLCIIVFSGIQLFSQETMEVFVSTDGSDDNPGSREQAFGSVQRAQAEVRRLLKSDKADIVVWLGGGKYELSETLVFTDVDGGHKGQSVAYKAFEGEEAVFSGGRELGGFEVHEGAIWKKKLGLKDLRQLYVNNQMATRARMPNAGDYKRVYMWDRQRHELYIEAEDIEGFENIEGLEMDIIMNWAVNKFRIESIELSSLDKSGWTNPGYARIKFKEPEDRIIYLRDHPPKRPDLPYHFENAYEFIDQEHEWYYNREEQVLYIMSGPQDRIEDFSVIVPKLQTLLSIEGSLKKPVQNLNFQGITFSHNGWLAPSDHGFIQLQSGNYHRSHPDTIHRLPAAVQLNNAHQISFTENTFCQLATSGLDFYTGVQYGLIEGNLFYQVGGNGIVMAKYSEGAFDANQPYLPSDDRERCQFNTIRNNLLSHVGVGYLGTTAIAIGYGNDILVEYNNIFDTPYSGITIGWGWRPYPNAMKNNTITKNKILRVCNLLCDGGGIYTLSAQPNSEISENYIGYIDNSKWACSTFNVGIYTDEGTVGYLVRDNHLEEIPKVKMRTKGDIKLEYNFKPNPEVAAAAGLQDPYDAALSKKLEELKKHAY